jgi:hypothetical protein
MALSNSSHPNCPKGEVAFASAPSASSAAVLGTCRIGRAPARWLSSQTALARPEECCSEPGSGPLSRTLLTVLTVFSRDVRILITLLPARPSRLSRPARRPRVFCPCTAPRERVRPIAFVCEGRTMLRARFCSRRERPADRVWFTRDHAQVGACCGVGLVAALLPIPDCSNRNMERGRELLL